MIVSAAQLARMIRERHGNAPDTDTITLWCRTGKLEGFKIGGGRTGRWQIDTEQPALRDTYFRDYPTEEAS